MSNWLRHGIRDICTNSPCHSSTNAEDHDADCTIVNVFRALLGKAGALHQDDIVLLLIVYRFNLQRDRLGNEVGKLSKSLGFLVQEQIDHILRSEDTIFARIELARLSDDLAQDLIANGLRGFHFTAPLTSRA